MNMRDLITLTEAVARSSLRAYHGTRHDFDKFLLRAVGSGEGAQVFGHGLYFAENAEVARFYADKLGMPSKPDDQHAGIIYEVEITLDPDTLFDYDASLIEQSQFVRDAFGDAFYREEPLINGERWMESMPANMNNHLSIISRNLYQEYAGDIDAFAKAFNARVANAKPEAQSQAAAIIALVRSATMTSGMVMKPGNGIHLINDLRDRHGSHKGVTVMLRKLGIRGIRYLDEGSRDIVGRETRNIVIFNARDVRIVKKTKVGVLPNI